jgi:hypothetical protein
MSLMEFTYFFVGFVAGALYTLILGGFDDRHGT